MGWPQVTQFPAATNEGGIAGIMAFRLLSLETATTKTRIAPDMGRPAIRATSKLAKTRAVSAVELVTFWV